MKPENELEAEEVAFVNTCRITFERLEDLHRGRAQFSMSVTTPTGTEVFNSAVPAQFIPAMVAQEDDAPVVETAPLTDAEFLAQIERDDEDALSPTIPPPSTSAALPPGFPMPNELLPETGATPVIIAPSPGGKGE